MLKGRCRGYQAKISKRYPLVELLTALAFAGESGVARKWMGAGGDDIIRLADCRASLTSTPMAARCFYSGRIVDRADCGMGPAESTLPRRSYRRPGGVYHFYSLRWIAGIVS